jgi:hypothetical protein
LQTPGRPTPRILALTIAAALAFAHAAQAQDTGQPALTDAQQALAEDFYRAEFVILERKLNPSDIDEKMAGRLPEPPDLNAEEILIHTSESGDTETTLKLVPQEELHLNQAAQRLERSGRYNVLLAEGWYQAFPPDFKGTPMWVSIGEWLPDAKHTSVQGMINIDRQRFLHVDVDLNHWMAASPKDNLLGLDLNAETPTRPHPPQIAIEPVGQARELPADGDSVNPEQNPERTLVAGLNWPRAELLTWIKETRRMRSEEVHFLDSPTLGVLIFFKKIEPEDAAPLILELGLTGE